MKSLKKVSSMLLCLFLVIGLWPANAFAAGTPSAALQCSISIEGGTAAFVGKNGSFSGTADAGDVLEVSLTAQPGREFKQWETLGGEVIPDADFKMLVGQDDKIWAVFKDTDDYEFGPWELLSSGNCEEGSLMKAVNSKGDVKYKIDYVNGGWHDFGSCVYADEEHHKEVCRICGYEQVSEHNFGSEEVVKEATHSEEGLKRVTCYGCGAAVDTVIPKTSEHIYDWRWTIVEPSVNGQPGKRSRKCLYCDHTETYWYMDFDYKSIFKDHFMEYYDSYGGKICHNERYYSYTNDEGQDVYVMALQYEYAYSSGKDGGTTWIWTYIDDGDDSTLDPIYLSRSNGETMGPYVQAHYGYVYDFEGYIDAIKNPDFVTSGFGGGIGFGNTMSARASALISWTDDWIEEYNNMYIPADKDPYDGFITTTGEFGRWEKQEVSLPKQAYYSANIGKDDEDNTIYEYVGGFQNCEFYRKWVSGDGESKVYDHIVIDADTGMAVSKTIFTTYYRTQDYFNKYKEMVTADEYEAIDENLRGGYFLIDDVEKDIKDFCGSNGRNNFGTFSLTIPEKPTAVRVVFDDTYGTGSTVSVSCSGQVPSPYYNNGHVFWVPQSSDRPNERIITLTWNSANAPGRIFDAWEQWDYSQAKWVRIGTEESITINTYGDPLTGPTFIRTVSHINEQTHHITAEGGFFYIGGDGGEKYTEADVTEGEYVYLYYEAPEGMLGDHWEDGDGNSYGYYKQQVNEDRDYTAFYVKEQYSIYASAYNGCGTVWVDGQEDEHSSYCMGKGAIGDVIRFCTEGDAENGYDQFLGWYIGSWGKGGQTFTKIGSDTTLEYTVNGNFDGDLYAVWSDGNVSLDPDYITVRVTDGFACADGGEIYIVGDQPNAYSALSLTQYNSISLSGDPAKGAPVLWKISYSTEEGPQERTQNGEENYYYVEYYDYYAEKTVNITAVYACSDGHSYGEWQAPDDGGNYKYEVCSVCGDVHVVANEMDNAAVNEAVNAEGEVVIDASAVEGRTENTVEIPAETVSAVAEEASNTGSAVQSFVVIVNQSTSVSYDQAALVAIDEQMNDAGASSVSVVVNEVDYEDNQANDAQQETFNNYASDPANGTAVFVVALEVTTEDAQGNTATEEICDFGEGEATVTVPYYQYVDEGEEVVVERVEQDGSTTEVESEYSSEDDTVTFKTNSHSYYMINTVPFRKVISTFVKKAAREFRLSFQNRLDQLMQIWIPQFDEDGRFISVSLKTIDPKASAEVDFNADAEAESAKVLKLDADMAPLDKTDSLDLSE